MNKNINERLKITVVGCGQAGGSITARIEESVNDLGGNKANTSFVGINTSTEDLASVKLSHKIHMNNSKGNGAVLIAQHREQWQPLWLELINIIN